MADWKNRLKNRAKHALTVGLYVVAGLVVLARLMPWGFWVSSDRAVDTMEMEGWAQVRVEARHEWAPHWIGGCDQFDTIAFEITGINAANKPSSATVCCGFIFKECTIRH